MSDTRDARAAAAEVKFVVEAGLGQQIRRWARLHLQPDPHGAGPFGDEYRTATIYFDTEDRDVFHRRGSYARAKYRVRRYGDSDVVFLERKLRRPGLLVKRRTQVLPEELRLLDPHAAVPDAWAGEWLRRRVRARRLGPACEIVYRRMARQADTPGGPVRLTVDHDLAAATVGDVAFSSGPQMPVLEGQVIVEIKFRGPMPGLFKRLVEELVLAPRPVSKYRCGVSAATGEPIPDGETPWHGRGLRA